MSSLEDMFDMAECVYTNGGFDMGRHLLQFNTEPVASSVTYHQLQISESWSRDSRHYRAQYNIPRLSSS
jgi:hypothetical protein